MTQKTNRNNSHGAYKVFYEKLEKVNFKQNCVRNIKGFRNPIYKKTDMKEKTSDSASVRSRASVFNRRNSKLTQEKGNNASLSQFSKVSD